MRKSGVIIGLFATFFFTQKSEAQTATELEQIGYLLSDALLYSEQYIIPATGFQIAIDYSVNPRKFDEAGDYSHLSKIIDVGEIKFKAPEGL